ncbi:hypothetical protein G6F37_007942 [Rhizopus arrhizus]|nr:hypothetical protein G6F38_009319 [Rhizopus arrhizus]KAG1156076.1 hypothetical protein G6F37_007942 [Rhizopus arrhizus]
MTQNFGNERYQEWLPHSQPTSLYQAPHIIDFNPKQGQSGDVFMIHTTLNNFNSALIRITFGSCILPTHFTINHQTISFHSHIPIQSSTSTEKVPIYLIIIREGTEDDIDVMDSWFAGYFTYKNKRITLNDDLDNNMKRTRIADQRHSTYLPHYYYHHLPLIGLSQREIDSLQNYPNYRPPDSFTSNHPQQNLTVPLLPNNFRSSMVSAHPLYPLQPIQPQFSEPIPITSGIDPPPDLSLDPFANVLSHATLTIQGDLTEMTIDWTEQEKKDQRRLVQFWRKQKGTNSVTAQFNIYRPKHPQDPPDFITSCIYWESRQDYYITSVDYVGLLQFVIGVVFTTEERNRVRRNLEGLVPETISKHKQDTAEFYKQIMSYPKPKPRNIEKNLKVFKWSKISEGLDKIVSRFTASYSTTMSIITDDNHNNLNE